MSSSSWVLGPYLGHLSNREAEYQAQNILVKDEDGRLQFTPFTRRIRTFPTELLAEIFTLCVPDDDFVAADPDEAPLVLCGVCHRWREVSLTTPKLWSSLYVDLDWAGRSEGYIDLCETWLDRAGRSPLSLFLHATDVYTVPFGDTPIHIGSLLQTIHGLSRRWQNIVVHLEPADVDMWEALFFGAKYPRLEKLTIHEYNPYTIHPDFPSFYDAPRLREIVAPIDEDALSVERFPWEQITTFRSREITLSSCLEILDDASDLVNGTFEVRGGRLGDHPSIISQIHLQSLILTEEPMIVLDRLTAPVLTNLTLRFPSYRDSLGGENAVSSFLSFVSRSSLRLRSLALSFMPATAENLIECLKAVPSLMHLKLEPPRAVDVNTLVAQLTGDSDFLPELESLHMFCTDRHSRQPQVVARMLRWRWDAVGITRLRSFQMSGSYRELFEDEDANAEFERLGEEGMDLDPELVGSLYDDLFAISTGLRDD